MSNINIAEILEQQNHNDESNSRKLNMMDLFAEEQLDKKENNYVRRPVKGQGYNANTQKIHSHTQLIHLD